MSRPLPFYDETLDFLPISYLLNAYFLEHLGKSQTTEPFPFPILFEFLDLSSPIIHYSFYAVLQFIEIFLAYECEINFEHSYKYIIRLFAHPKYSVSEKHICLWTLRESYSYKGNTVDLWLMYDISLAVAILYSLMSSSVDTIRKLWRKLN